MSALQTAEAREARAVLIYRRVWVSIADAVREEEAELVALSYWPEAWRRAEPGDLALSAHMDAWVRTGDDASASAAMVEASRFVRTWRDTARAWLAAGCPSSAPRAAA